MGEIMVVEADESDGTVAGYSPDYSIITNIEYDHMEHHDSEAAFVGCFEKLIEKTKDTVYFCADDRMAKKLCINNPKCKPYGFPEPALPLPIPGNHNQWNASAACAVSKHWKTDAEIFKAFETIRPIGATF